MMIPDNIARNHILKAIQEIDREGIPKGRNAKKFKLVFDEKAYPPKYVISLANKYANGEELEPSDFGGGPETNTVLTELRFEIAETSSTTKDNKKSSRSESTETTQKEHNERCPDCKDTIERMLKRIYGAVKPNYKFRTGTNPEDFSDKPFYDDLQRIYENLQKYKGNKNFVIMDTLPNCDYYVPDPGFVLEFDESQHFTMPRKIALLSYPYKSRSGFSLAQWISTCDKIKAQDLNPIYRDEQRAWYDTLRDFLPELKGLEPTVRLYSNEMQWCSLNLDNRDDVAHFKAIIEARKRVITNWITTVVIQSGFCSLDAKFEADLNNRIIADNLKGILEAHGLSLTEPATVKNEREGEWVITSGEEIYRVYKEDERLGIYKHHNEERLNVLSTFVKSILKQSTGDGVILFPAGMFYTEDKAASTFYNRVQETLIPVLKQTNDHVIVCTGVDSARDQIAIAVDKTGIIAKGRKFHPAPGEDQIELAPDYSTDEDGKSCIFELNGTRYCMCVCYDIFGLRHKDLRNPGVDVVLNLVHCFYQPGKGPSGLALFAKHGLAGASKQWKCPVFAAVVFFKPNIPMHWPTGVYWNQGDKSTRFWRYSDNPIKPADSFEPEVEEGAALVRMYKHPGLVAQAQ